MKPIYKFLTMLKPLYFLLLARRRLANITLPYSYGHSSMLPLCASSLFLYGQVKDFLFSKLPHTPPPHSYCLARGSLFLLAGISFLVLTACGGGTSGGSGSGTDDPPGTEPSIRGLDCLADASSDCDGDNVMDEADVDDDGDGLIEIRTAAQLDAVRYALDGSGRRLLASAEFDDTGCGGDSGITSCSGYELVADISLTAYDDGKGWQPLGNDTDSVNAGCQGVAFNGTFEGNGWMISDLNINRPNEDCVGLFGYIAADSEIRNLILHAEAVIGNNSVGALVGRGSSATIVYSSVVVGEVSGTSDNVGGLMGNGASVRIYSSSVVASQVSGSSAVGGLMGNGASVRIYSSSVVAGQVSGTGNSIGGLVGRDNNGQIYSSSVVINEVSGSNTVGGLVGWNEITRIFSSSVVVGKVIGNTQVGGLVGLFIIGQLAYSYLVSGSNTNMLAELSNGKGVASYWDSETSGVTSGNLGAPKTTSELRGPTDYTDIYANWTKDVDIFGDGMIDEPLAVWCDKDNSGSIEIGEKTPDNLIWDFGESDEYPAIRCTPLAPADWRDWWFLNETDQPQLDQSRLDQLLP